MLRIILVLGLLALLISYSCIAQTQNLAELQRLDNLASRAQNEGDYVTALKYRRSLLSKINKIKNLPESERARQMSNLASIFNLMGKPEAAEKLLLSAKELLQHHPSDDPIQYAVLYGNLAQSQRLKGGLLKSEKNYLKALSIVTRHIGANNVFAASDKEGLAFIYTRQGKYSIATQYYQEAYNVYCQISGPTHRVIKRIKAEFGFLLQQIEKANRKEHKTSNKALNLTAPTLRCGAAG